MRPLHVCTLLTQKPPQILSYINKLSEKFSGKDCTFLFALSSNFDHPNDLEEVVCTMRNLRRDRGKGKARLIGCLSGPVSDMELPGGNHAGLSCAVAVYNSMHCVPFHSRLQGRKEAQVGRWHSFRPDSSPTLDLLEVRKGENVNWEDVWNNKISSSINRDIVSEELRLISYVNIAASLYISANLVNERVQTFQNPLSIIHDHAQSGSLHVRAFTLLVIIIELHESRSYCCTDAVCNWPRRDNLLR